MVAKLPKDLDPKQIYSWNIRGLSYAQFVEDLRSGRIVMDYGYAAKVTEQKPLREERQTDLPKRRPPMNKVEHSFQGYTKTWAEWADLIDWRMDRLMAQTRVHPIDYWLILHWDRVERNLGKEGKQ